MSWKIEYPYHDVEKFVLELPAGLAARYIHLTDLMIEFGSDLGMPHSKSLSKGLFELSIKSHEGKAMMVLREFFIAPKLANEFLCCMALLKRAKKRHPMS